jgi:hypothetical protein
MRIGFLVLLAVVIGCGPERDNNALPDADEGSTTCTGIECQVVDCEKKGLPPTSVSGTVFAPNGTLALYGAVVYVPFIDPGPFKEGVECTQCVDQLPGGAVAHTISDTAGKFTLSNIPSGTDIPLFITIGKWRRKVTIPSVVQCQDNPLPAVLTSLPRNKFEGDIPRIAIATGSCDALECLLRKIGIADGEFTSDSGGGRIHLYSSNGASMLPNSTPMSPAATLWGNQAKMMDYDLMMFSCECSQRANEKPQAYMDNLKAYADAGGRVFLSHYHAVWIEGERNVPTHADEYGSGTGIIDTVGNPKGSAFAEWMMNVQGSTSLGSVAITESRQSCSAVDSTRAERWVYMPIGGVDYPQNFQFTTPNELPKEERCGKVVFSDMHVASGSSSSGAFPSGCSATAMSPQEKALAFMLFDIATCVGPIL